MVKRKKEADARNKRAVKYEYNDEDVEKALEEVKKGVPIQRAARIFGIPRQTLSYKSKGLHLSSKKGPESYLTETNEAILVRWVLTMKERGLAVTPDGLMDSVQSMLRRLGIQVKEFVRNRPGSKWLTLFLKRHPEVALRTPQALGNSRANVSEQEIRDWFRVTKEYLVGKNLMWIFAHPERVFNCDEVAVFLNPKSPKNGKTGGKVLAGRGDRTIYTVSGNGEKECVTVLMAANAAGMKAPPMIVYKYERIPEEIAKSVPKGWGIGRSPKSGWMFSCLFYEWVTNVFEPWLTTNSIERPAFLFLDGHQSHLTMELSDFCVEKQIEIIPLYPNATHIMQPLDVAVFKPLKDKWKKLVRNWRFDHAGERLLKTDFPALLSTALDEVTDDVVRSGFVATGLCPFNPDVIDFSNLILPHNKFDDTCSSNDTSTVSNNCSLSATSTVNGSSMESHITALESNISPCKLERFKQCSNDESIPIEDKSLYKVWKRLKSNASTDISDTLSPGTLNASHNQSLAQFSEDILPENESTPPSEYRPPPKNCPPADIPSPFKDALRWPTLQKKNAGKKKKKDFPLAITSDAWRNHHKKVQQEKSQKEKEKEEKKSLRLQKKQLNDQKKKLNGQKRMLKEQKKKNVKRKLTYVSEDTDNDDSVTSWVESSDSSEYEKSFDEEEMAAYAKKRSMKNDKTPKQPKDSFMKEVKVGQWVIVRFKMSQQAGRTRKFIGQIDGVQNGKLIGNFVRPASTKKNFGYVYKFPEKLDKTSFSFLQVEKILLNPKPYGRYGLLLFQVNAKDL